jgi:hypothetical protein
MMEAYVRVDILLDFPKGELVLWFSQHVRGKPGLGPHVARLNAEAQREALSVLHWHS